MDTKYRGPNAFRNSMLKPDTRMPKMVPPYNPSPASVVRQAGGPAFDNKFPKSRYPRGGGQSGVTPTLIVNTAPQITNVSLTPSLAQALTVSGSTIVTVTATDAEGNAITFSLTDSNGGKFAIDASTGVVTCTTNLLAVNSPFPFTVRVTDSLGAYTSKTFTLTVTP